MTTSHWFRQHSFTTPDTVSDIVIIGAGYVGLSTAFWLTEMRPDLKITILDRSHVGAGASGRNAGFLTIGSAFFYKNLSQKWGPDKAQAIHAFGSESIDLVFQHILKSSPELKFERTASWTLFQNESALSDMRSTWSPENFKFEWKDGSQLPSQLQGKFFGALETSPEFKVNPAQLLATLRKRLESRKIQIIENISAFELTADGVRTEINFIKTKQVVLALNGYFPQFNRSFEKAIVPRRAQMLAVELEEELECPHLYYDPPERVYWRKAHDKVLLIGGKRLLDETGETGDFEKISPLVQKGLEDYLRNQLGLKYKVINRWSGTMGFTEHELPLIGKVNAPIETTMIGGFSGHGMGFGFRSAKDAAEIVLGQSQQSFFQQFKEAQFTL
jgi:gamma-glutamylputrescine oxidase